MWISIAITISPQSMKLNVQVQKLGRGKKQVWEFLMETGNVLHHWELFIVCLNRFPLNSPFIHFITSQRAGTLKEARLLRRCVKLHWSRDACLGTQSTPSALRLKSADAHAVHSMYMFKVYYNMVEPVSCCFAEKVSLSKVLPPLQLWVCCCVADPDLRPPCGREERVSPAGINKLSHHSASNILTGNCLDFICMYASRPCANYALFSLQLTAGLL